MSTILLDRYRANSLPHAVLLHGSAEAATVAVEALINELNLNPADYLIIEAGSAIKIADAKRVKNFVQLTRFTSPIKLVFLADAAALTPEAANALLKTLEEPPSGSHLILASTKIDVLLPTIRSRCQQISLGQVKTSFDGGVPDLKKQDLASAFALSKELAASDIGLPTIFSQWALQLAGEEPTITNRHWQRLILDYLGPAQTSVNRRLLLDNFLLDIYNSD